MIPNNLLEIRLEFTPVDICAMAIVLIVQNELKDFSILHLFNDNTITMENFLNFATNIEEKIEVVSDNTFRQKVNQILNDKSKNNILFGIINDLDNNNFDSYKNNVNISSDLSKIFLAKLNFIWPKIDSKYIKQYIQYFKQINLI